MSTPSSLLDLDDSFNLDSNLNDVPDLPDFMTRFVGRGIFQIASVKNENYVAKDGATKGRIRFIYRLAKVIEAGEQPMPKVGDMMTEQFGTTGSQFLKARLKQLIPDGIKDVPLGQILDFINGDYAKSVCVDITAKMKSSNGYDNIQIIRLVPCEYIEIEAA